MLAPSAAWALVAGGNGGEVASEIYTSMALAGGYGGYRASGGAGQAEFQLGTGGGGGGQGFGGGMGGVTQLYPGGWVAPMGGSAGTVSNPNGGWGMNGQILPDDTSPIGDGGGGGGGGASVAQKSGDAVFSPATSGMPEWLYGGAGGNGGKGGGYIGNGVVYYAGGGGGGGAGGTAIVHSGNGTIQIRDRFNVVGGNGGAGGEGGALHLQPGVTVRGGGNGGGGGNAIASSGVARIEIDSQAVLLGGNGGAGGNGAAMDPYTAGISNGGNGGNGGDAIDLSAGGVIVNAGTIRGSNGGAGGAGSSLYGQSGRAGQTGMGGAAITGRNVSIINSGEISGGMGAGGQSYAIRLTSGTNRLELWGTSVIHGNVVVFGSNNVLALGGSTNQSFDVSQIGASYDGFSQFEKAGTSTWTLSGSPSRTTPWKILGGTLSVASDVSLGPGAGGLTLDGGTLRTTASLATARATTIGGNGGSFSVDSGTTLTHNGTISGPGQLTKDGWGTLALTGTNTYAGSTVLNAGRLESTGNALGTGSITVNGGTLSLTQGFDAGNRVVRNAGGYILMYEDASLAQATVENVGGITYLNRNGTAANATIINSGGTMSFQEGSTAGNSRVVTNDGSLTEFWGRSDSANATLIANGSGKVDFSGTSGPAANRRLTAASIEGSGRFLLGRNRLTVGADNRSTEVSGTIEDGGAGGGTGGALTKTGTGTLLLNGANTYTGTTEVNGGKLVVGDAAHAGARVAGPVNVNAGATLGGFGTVGSTVVANGATIAPGNSIGTLTVNGNLRLDAGSTYLVEADPGSSASDRIAVTGTATLGGAVVHIGPDGSFASTRSYTILTAGALQGSFGSVASNYAFLDPTLTYGANDVTLQLTRKQVPVDPQPPEQPQPPVQPEPPVQPKPPVQPEQPGPTRPIRFADAAVTGNQVAVANALDSLPDSNALHEAVLTLPQGAPPAVFDSLSGEAHASTATGLITLASGARTVPLNHLRDSLSAGLMPGALIAQVGGPLPAAALPVSAAQPMWVDVVGNWQTLNGDGNGARVRQQTGGFHVGADGDVGAGWRAGGAFGFANSTLRVSERASRAITDSFSATVYGGRAFEVGGGKLNLLLGSAYSWHEVDTDRQATIGTHVQALSASYSASTAQVFTELGYAMPLSRAAHVEPYAGVAWSDTRTRGFGETGGSAALHSPGDRNTLAMTTVGLRAGTRFQFGNVEGAVYAGAGWRHAFGDVLPSTTLAFAGSQTFTVTGAPIARNAGVAELRADLALSRTATFSVRYAGQFGDGNRDHTASAGLRWRF